MAEGQLVVMARWPAPGRCKSRLATSLGRERAAAIQRRLTAHTLAVAAEARRRLPFELVLAVSGVGPRAARRWQGELGCDRVVDQGAGGLGLRLQRQVRRGCSREGRQLVVIGTDLPGLLPADLEQAFAALGAAELVLGPAGDGGYWLIGLRRSWPALFSGVAWGTGSVLEQTRQAASRLGLSPHHLARRCDLDRPADLRPWR